MFLNRWYHHIKWHFLISFLDFHNVQYEIKIQLHVLYKVWCSYSVLRFYFILGCQSCKTIEITTHDAVTYLGNGTRALFRANQVNGHTSWTSDADSLAALWYDPVITDWKIGGLKYLGTSTGGIVTANDNPNDCPWSNQNQDKWKYYDGSSWKYLNSNQITVRCSEGNFFE